MNFDKLCEQVFDISSEMEDQEDLEDAYSEMYELIIHYFPECKKSTRLGGDETTPVFLVKRNLEDGLGFTQIGKSTLKLEKVLISDKVLSMDTVHYDSVIAHEAAHVTAYNYIWSQDDTVSDELHEEWVSTKGHTKKWHEIVDKLNSIKRKSTGKNAFDIVENVSEQDLERYFSD